MKKATSGQRDQPHYFLGLSPEDMAGTGLVGSMLVDHPALRAMHEALEALIAKLKSRPDIVTEIKPNILLTGETGTGKEVVAQAIRQRLMRERLLPAGDSSYEAVNCACLSAKLLEIELFGTTRHAFTDAGELLGIVPRLAGYKSINSEKRQLVGSPQPRPAMLFLDEIGAAGLKVQAKLLRLLEYREFSPLGVEGRSYKAPGLIIVSATNELGADWGSASRQSKQKQPTPDRTTFVERPFVHHAPTFRDDLFYRLGDTFHFHLPPLKERRNEIPLIAQQFFQKYYRWIDSQAKVPELPPDLIALLKGLDWLGNGRQLHQVIRRALILWDGNDMAHLIRILGELGTTGTIQVNESVAERG